MRSEVAERGALSELPRFLAPDVRMLEVMGTMIMWPAYPITEQEFEASNGSTLAGSMPMPSPKKRPMLANEAN